MRRDFLYYERSSASLVQILLVSPLYLFYLLYLLYSPSLYHNQERDLDLDQDLVIFRLSY